MTQQKPIAIASDHAGKHLKDSLIQTLTKQGVRVADLGPDDTSSVDYPDYALRVTQAILEGSAGNGILICGSGIGMSMAANRHAHIRAALCHNVEATTLARQHNDANILVLGARVIDETMAISCVEAFLRTPFDGGRHQGRIDKFSE